ncbi:MAG: flagellar biosynthetic protein FliR [Aquabacterium sp.]
MNDPLLWVQATMLASVRLTLGLAMTPLFSAFGVPMLARLILTLTLAGLAANVMPASQAHAQLTAAYLVPAIGNEVALGLLLSVGVHTAFAAFAVAGRLIDAQLGFTLGAVLDPVSKGHAAVMASGLNMLAILLFFLTDAHHLLLSGFFRTFELLPIGRAVAVDGWFPMAQGAGAMFSMGFVIASPVVIALLLADVVVAVVSRNLPQMNVMFLSIPLKVLLGMAVMAASVQLLAPVMQKVLALPLSLLDKVQ